MASKRPHAIQAFKNLASSAILTEVSGNTLKLLIYLLDRWDSCGNPEWLRIPASLIKEGCGFGNNSYQRAVTEAIGAGLMLRETSNNPASSSRYKLTFTHTQNGYKNGDTYGYTCGDTNGDTNGDACGYTNGYTYGDDISLSLSPTLSPSPARDKTIPLQPGEDLFGSEPPPPSRPPPIEPHPPLTKRPCGEWIGQLKLAGVRIIRDDRETIEALYRELERDQDCTECLDLVTEWQKQNDGPLWTSVFIDWIKEHAQ